MKIHRFVNSVANNPHLGRFIQDLTISSILHVDFRAPPVKVSSLIYIMRGLPRLRRLSLKLLTLAPGSSDTSSDDAFQLDRLSLDEIATLYVEKPVSGSLVMEFEFLSHFASTMELDIKHSGMHWGKDTLPLAVPPPMVKVSKLIITDTDVLWLFKHRSLALEQLELKIPVWMGDNVSGYTAQHASPDLRLTSFPSMSSLKHMAYNSVHQYSGDGHKAFPSLFILTPRHSRNTTLYAQDFGLGYITYRCVSRDPSIRAIPGLFL
ncbi:unnamed protein product [Somion occarium]|uniref:F-box protein n=1 Tax=Somion occarium TaxID=3059160 RepID=A0ABP1E545_9APHY